MKRSIILIASLWAAMLLTSPTVHAIPFGGGAGEPNAPYQIWTAEQMNAIGADPNLWDKHFILMADLDLSAYDGQDGREAFNLIGEIIFGSRTGYAYNGFKGVFDGNGHSIINFSTVSHSENCWGLFRVVEDPNAEIKNLTLIHPILVADAEYGVGALVDQLLYGASISNCHVEDSIIIGDNDVGGLVGHSAGSITGCHASGIVIGENRVGGLVGYSENSLIECYATGTVIGNNYIGGLAGISQALRDCYAISTVFATNIVGGLAGGAGGYIQNCYAASTLFTAGSPYEDDSIGGLVGYGFSGRGGFYDSADCFYDLQVSGYPNEFGEDRTTAQMQTAVTFLAWAEGDSAGVWTIDEDHDYPRLAWEGRPGVPIETMSFSDLVAGSGTKEAPYLIESPKQLYLLAISPALWNYHFKLTADLDLTEFIEGSLPCIGTWESPFTGVFDGNGHTISGYVHIASDSDEDDAGLFGRVGNFYADLPRATIKNLGLIEPRVDGKNCYGVGALAGFVARENIIEGCYVKGGHITGNWNTGGLIGLNQGLIRNCYASTTVHSNYCAGGLAGIADGGRVENCFSTSLVSGDEDTGGLFGSAKEPPVQFHCFWDIEISGQATSREGTGLTTAQMQTVSTFLNAGWDFIGESDNGTEDIWWMPENDHPRLWWEFDPTP